VLINKGTRTVFDSAEGVESAFYHAFGSGDFKLMESLYADSSVSCTHPGATTLVGREKVLTYWEFILEGIPKIYIDWQILCSTRYENVEVHQVLESYIINDYTQERSEIYTTNVFVLQDNGWRLQMQHTSLPEVKTMKPNLSFISNHQISNKRVLN